MDKVWRSTGREDKLPKGQRMGVRSLVRVRGVAGENLGGVAVCGVGCKEGWLRDGGEAEP